MTQKRKDRRVKQWCRAVVQPPPTGPDSPPPSDIEAFICDLSLAGARLHAKVPFEMGAVVRLRIDLVRTRETLCVTGRIMWVKKSGGDDVFEMGVEFLHSTGQTIMCLMKDLHGMSV